MTTSPFERRLAARDSGHHGRKAEQKVAKRLGGKQQPGSGAIAGAKGDVQLVTRVKSQPMETERVVPDFLLENKTTVGESFGMRQDWTLKIYQEALECNKAPAIAFQFVDGEGRSDKRNRWVAIPEHIFKELIGD